MEGLRLGIPAVRLNLLPGFVLWAAIAATLVLIGGVLAWMVRPAPVRGLLGRLWLSDLAAAWAAYAALYHLAFLPAFRLVLGEPWALWGLCGLLGFYLLLRRLPTPARRPEVLFAMAVLTWAGVIAAGQGTLAEMEADATLLTERPQAALRTEAPVLRPLRRALLLTRLEADTRAATARVLTQLEGAAPTDAGLLAAWRIAHLPRVLEHYRRDRIKLATYQWLQGGLLAVLLLVWGFGVLPEQERG